MLDGRYNILSLGAGVQSSTLLLMSCRGDVPKLDAAVFADTGWEPQAVYEQLAWLEVQAEGAGIPVHRVGDGKLREDALRSQVRGKAEHGQRWASLPYHTIDAEGGRGLIKRQCTKEYKIQPIEQFLRRVVLGLKPRQHAPREVVIDHWYGISADESRRIRISRNLWQRHVYPLCGIPELWLLAVMTRNHCGAWLQRHYPGRTFVRSACVGCPFRSDDEWRWLATQNDWASAVEFDIRIRKCGGTRGDIYVHRSCAPLDGVDLSTDFDKGQLPLWPMECAGVCNV